MNKEAIAAVREALDNELRNLHDDRRFTGHKRPVDDRIEALHRAKENLAAIASLPIEGGDIELTSAEEAFIRVGRSKGINFTSGEEMMQIQLAPRAENGKLTDIPDLADKLTAHLAKIKLPADPHGWKVIVRIALIGALEKHLATKGDQTT